ncbi:class I SAM-dependent methyltransferase [Gellertiella hungarica]|uniref:16S rRNA (Guanine1207-N2)-methyltransferase n=1 Tax=Gellertiella hungarica TaxID=1572859 RepID=A0A7W6J6T7_9HYPH|nr:class I SAM-dependent methyltransferase [Gellertiella hungarica]MBB4065861.1 16S rRNA (guanine1207-N2)-methyltransferase [Gellertiella hungarica]
MARETLKTLFHPFASGTVEPPAEGERVLFLGAEAGYPVPDGFGAAIVAVQGFRPLYRRLEAQRVDVHPALPEGPFDAGLMLLNKHRGENESRLATLLTRVKPGGLVVLAGSKEDGIQPMRKLLTQLGIAFDHMPKYHGVACWFTVPEDAAALSGRLARPQGLVAGRFRTAPGMFSHERPDEGSELLASRLPADFDGNAADFGAGWGFLSVALAEKSPRTARIDLFEADHAALEAARENLAAIVPDLQARFFWQDLAAEEVKERYDMVIMNPPFHEGHAAEPGLGQAMIRAAIKALRPGGRLMLVANRGLPYEPILAEGLRESGETCRNARFKVLWGRK